jgi:hypothetical protein
MTLSHKISVQKSEGTRLCERPRLKREDIIRKELKGIECGIVDWTHQAQDMN